MSSNHMINSLAVVRCWNPAFIGIPVHRRNICVLKLGFHVLAKLHIKSFKCTFMLYVIGLQFLMGIISVSLFYENMVVQFWWQAICGTINIHCRITTPRFYCNIAVITIIIILTVALWATPYYTRDHCGCGLSQWETTFQCNVVSHWLSPCHAS